MACSIALILAGSAASVVAARVQAGRNATQVGEDLATLSTQVASGLRLAIEHEQDLVTSTGAFVAGDQSLSSSVFQLWATRERALARYPEITGLGYLVLVRASKLDAFVRAVERPGGIVAPGGVFRVEPTGKRAFYCFAAAGVGRPTPASTLTPPGTDYCAGLAGGPLLSARDSGRSAYIPQSLYGSRVLAIFTPVYRGGTTVPATVAARRAAFIAWVAVTVTPTALLRRALSGHPGAAVSFRYNDGRTGVSFDAGTAVHGARSATVDLHNGWTVRTSAVVPATGLFANGQPGALLTAGVLISLLVGGLVFVLGTGRARARRLVAIKTGELSHQALHDALTGLPNRALIVDRLERLTARSRRHGVPAAVLFVDLDEFKSVNDTLGHETGDRLLVAVAARLTIGLREVDTVGRLGGDEFVVLIDGESQVGPELVAERLLVMMRQPFELGASTTPITISASVGAAVGVGTGVGELLRDADMALYQAKAAGKNCYEVFRPEMETQLRHSLELELDLRSALAHDEFRLVYQPIYDLDGLALVGVEALLRWDHPTLGVIAPNEIIPLLERSGGIVEVGRWVLRTACLQMAAWHDLGSVLGVSVNVAARQLDSDGVVSDVRDALAESGLEPAALTIEITETALMRDVDATARRLRELKALHVTIAIDDFGTGYSSLASLQHFAVDVIKIDRAFTDAITRSPESDALIRVLVQLGRDLGLRTLAEGVETTDQLDHLRREHVNDVQGFLLSEPLDVAEVQALILPALAARTPSAL